MGRRYKGLDHTKVTVKLNDRQSDIVGQYHHYIYEQSGWEVSCNASDTIRAAIDLLGQYIEMASLVETAAANLLDIAQTFDKIGGKRAGIHAQAIREAAALLLMFYSNADVKMEDGKIVIVAKSPTKPRQKKQRETTVTIQAKEAEPWAEERAKEKGETPSGN